MRQTIWNGKKLGFGCMRLPMIGDEVDIEQFKVMADLFLASGFTYFDTAHGYIDEKSEPAIREAVVKRHPRESFSLTNKLSGGYFQKEEDIRPLFEKQLEACGVSYFDYYLMHAQNADVFAHFKACRAYETAFALKAEGKIRHVGISFHDQPEVLDQILTEYPELEIVQIQYNYLDQEDEHIQSRRCFEICQKHRKPILVMEPIKGGSLIHLPPKGKEKLSEVGMSPAEFALRYAASPEDMAVVLSGMSNIAQMEDNISFMKEFKPLTEEERQVALPLVALINEERRIPCTDCRYCIPGCPMQIQIPFIFRWMNAKRLSQHIGNPKAGYAKLCEDGHAPASQCLHCGLCEASCPQHLPIRNLLEEAAQMFEDQ